MFLGPPKHSWSGDRIFEGATKCPGLIPAPPSSHRQVGHSYIFSCPLMDDFQKEYTWIWKWHLMNNLHAFLSLICPVLQSQQCWYQSYSGKFGGDLHFPADVGSVLGRAYKVSLPFFILLYQGLKQYCLIVFSKGFDYPKNVFFLRSQNWNKIQTAWRMLS